VITLFRLFRAGFHTVLLFVLPWGTGVLAAMAFDIGEVTESGGEFASYFALVAMPLLLLQLVAVAVKVGREMRIRRAAGKSGFAVFVEALDRHVRVLTGRGLGMAIAAIIMVFIALGWKWGQFGILAVAGLGIMYIASTGATVVSAFAVRAFDDRVRRGRGAIDREMSPTVVDAGDPVEERFFLARVPVPPGFRIHIEEALPERLGGDTRFALDRTVSRAEITVSAPLPKTPRGVYKLGPADVWYEDILGLTRVFVAAKASASLRALPRLRPIVFDRKPQSKSKSEGPHSILSRLATEEHFRTRPYVHGDDLRRVHWKQSINTGNLIVRVPESVPFAPTRVRLVLDTFLPPGRPAHQLEEVLDLLVEAWVGLAHMLLKRGEKVTLVACIDGVKKEVECKRGEERAWRSIGADAKWQNTIDHDDLLDPGSKTAAIILSAGLFFRNSAPVKGTSFIIADGASVITVDDDPEKSTFRQRLFISDFPAGAEDNKIDLARWLGPKPPDKQTIKDELGVATSFAVNFARSAQAPVSLVRRRGTAIALEAP
jgi:uncharacterized protein (DUF58 family)